MAIARLDRHSTESKIIKVGWKVHLITLNKLHLVGYFILSAYIVWFKCLHQGC